MTDPRCDRLWWVEPAIALTKRASRAEAENMHEIRVLTAAEVAQIKAKYANGDPHHSRIWAIQSLIATVEFLSSPVPGTPTPTGQT